MAGFLRNFAVLSAAAVYVVMALPGTSRGQETEESPGVKAISPGLCKQMKAHHVLNAGAPVGCDRLKLVQFSYIDFQGRVHDDGEIVVLDAIAKHVSQVLKTLESRGFPIAQARLMNEYDGNDDASMDQNNTSAFNHREIAGGGSVSLHAYGVAIDLNPEQNPYLRRARDKLTISPLSGEKYLDRKNLRPGMSEAVIEVFAEHGLSGWGGFWNNPTDYQHFQISRHLVDELIHASPSSAAQMYEEHIKRYLACLRTKNAPKEVPIRRVCAAVD
jgi:D-alanyl-D-alanine carboxypeptidase